MTGGIGYPIRERGRGEGGNGKVSFLLRKNGSLEAGALLCVHSAGKQVVIAADANAPAKGEGKIELRCRR